MNNDRPMKVPARGPRGDLGGDPLPLVVKRRRVHAGDCFVMRDGTRFVVRDAIAGFVTLRWPGRLETVGFAKAIALIKRATLYWED